MLKVVKNKFIRRYILICIDIFILLISYILNFCFLEYSSFKNSTNLISINSAISYIFIGIFIYIISDQYKVLSEYFSRRDFYKLIIRNTLIVYLYSISENLFFKNNLEFTLYFLIWVFTNIFTCSIRILIREIYLFIKYKKNLKRKKSVAIYGAGQAGAMLNYLLTHNDYYKVEAFIDDSKLLNKRAISGIPIYLPENFFKSKKDIKTVLLSIPSLSHRRKREIINDLEIHNISVLMIPTLKDINEGKARINDLRPIEIEDLLDRYSVQADKKIMLKSIQGFNICITGAGGSIGSEICKEILKLNPNSLIILERNEPSLYRLENQLNELNNSKNKKIKIYPYLGDASNKALINKIFKENNVEIVFHSAAYKHVNIVQSNPIQGILNNVFSTYNICKNAKDNKLKKVILISTDKAVNPTNIMGASKRLCEMIIQAFSEEQINKNDRSAEKIIFSKVRFGNVLGSSGSVVPLFKKQLSEGGPITLTHKDVVRYFMTINEAVQLVIQASALSEGGDLFLLNMGESVRIFDLAKKMIRLSGLTIKDENNPEGDIEIVITGLRPGEKLFEELLVEQNSIPTIHPLIYKAVDNYVEKDLLMQKLERLKKALLNEETDKSLDLLSDLVPEWNQIY